MMRKFSARDDIPYEGGLTFRVEGMDGVRRVLKYHNDVTRPGAIIMLQRMLEVEETAEEANDLSGINLPHIDRIRLYDHVLSTDGLVDNTGTFFDVAIRSQKFSYPRVRLFGSASFTEALFRWTSADIVLSDNATALARVILPNPFTKTNSQKVDVEWDMRMRVDV